MISRWMTASAVLLVGVAALPGCYSRSKAAERRAASVVTAMPDAQAGAAAPVASVPEVVATGIPTPSPAEGARSMSARYSRPGFAVYEEDGRLWVFSVASKHHDTFLDSGEPAKSVTKIGEGPDGKTIRGAEAAVIDSYIDSVEFGRPGFAVFGVEGRLWVFEIGGEGLEEFLAFGEPAKSVTRIGAGPEGKTIRSVDNPTIDRYLATAETH